jgi:hypothetical protein
MANISLSKIVEGLTRHVQMPQNSSVRTTPQSIAEDVIKIQEINLAAEAWIDSNGMKGKAGTPDLCWQLPGRREEARLIVGTFTKEFNMPSTVEAWVFSLAQHIPINQKRKGEHT